MIQKGKDALKNNDMTSSPSILYLKGNRLTFKGKTYECAIGKGGFSDDKREGDHCTPLGSYPLRECWYRADKLEKPDTALALKVIGPDDGWCDDAASAQYNRHVKLPFASSHEKLFREDDVYDVIVPLGYNDRPVIAGKGSAIFVHIAKPGYEGTEGCVALKLADLLDILRHCGPDATIRIEH